jgi:hypothetical protein
MRLADLATGECAGASPALFNALRLDAAADHIVTKNFMSSEPP